MTDSILSVVFEHTVSCEFDSVNENYRKFAVHMNNDDVDLALEELSMLNDFVNSSEITDKGFVEALGEFSIYSKRDYWINQKDRMLDALFIYAEEINYEEVGIGSNSVRLADYLGKIHVIVMHLDVIFDDHSYLPCKKLDNCLRDLSYNIHSYSLSNDLGNDMSCLLNDVGLDVNELSNYVFTRDLANSYKI